MQGSDAARQHDTVLELYSQEAVVFMREATRSFYHATNRALLRLLVDKYAHLVVYVDEFYTSQAR